MAAGMPLFFTIALYDIKNKVKLSENFYCDNLVLCNLKKKLEKSLPPRIDPETECLEAWFGLPSGVKADALYLVLRCDKVYAGDPSPLIDLLAKGDKTKKNLALIDDNIYHSCLRNGEYRQPFFWTAVPVFDPQCGVLSKQVTCDLELNELIMSPQVKDLPDLYEKVIELKENRLKKPKKVRGVVECQLSVLSQIVDVPNRVDPSLALIEKQNVKVGTLPSRKEQQSKKEKKDKNDRETPRRPSDTVFEEGHLFDSQVPIIKTIQELEPFQKDAPMWQFLNLAYIYPELIDFRKHISSAKSTIFLQISLRDSDIIESKPLKNMFSMSTSENFSFSTNTCVSFKNEAPTFWEEKKVLLPAKLSEKHHLLFTFYHYVGGKNPSKKNSKLEFLGYCYLPLYPNKFISNGEKTLHIVTHKLEKGYISNPRPLTTAKQAAKFKFRLEILSSLYPTDPNLNSFLQLIGSQHLEDDEKTKQHLSKLVQTDPNVAFQWFPVIMSRLCFALLNYSKTIQIATVAVMIRLLKKLRLFINNPTAFRPEYFVKYLKFAFDSAGETGKTTLSKALCNNFLILKHRAQLGGVSADEKEINQEELLEFSWFMFELITRGHILQLAREGQLDDNLHRKEHFSDVAAETAVYSKVIAAVAGLIKDVSAHSRGAPALVAKKANMAVAFFCCDLFSVFDRGATHDLVATYVQCMSDHLSTLNDDEPAFVALYTFRFEFLKIVTDHEHYVPLCMPVPLRIESRINFTQHMGKQSPLATLLLNSVVEALSRPEPQLRQHAISTLNVLLTKHDFDARYSSPVAQERIAEMYFYLLPLLLDNHERFRHWCVLDPSVNQYEKRSFLLCVLYVLKSTPRATLRQWWKFEIRRVFFLELLEESIKAFQLDKMALNQAQEQNLSNEANMIALDVIADFIPVFKTEMSRKAISLLDKVFALLTLFLERPQSYSTLRCVFYVLRKFLIQFDAIIFGEEIISKSQKRIDYVGTLLFLLLPYTNYLDEQTRVLSASLIYTIIRSHFKVYGNLREIMIKSLTALNKIVIYNEYFRKASYENFEESLSFICQFSLSQSANPDKPDFRFLLASEQSGALTQYWKTRATKGCQVLALTLGSIITNIKKVNTLWDKTEKPETLHELYFQIAQSHSQHPELRIEWLNKLQQSHYQHRNYAECAICNLHIFALLSIPLTRQQRGIEQSDLDVIQEICPDVIEDADEDFEMPDMEKQAVRALETAITSFEKAGYFEFCIALSHIFVKMYDRLKRFNQLSSVFTQISTFYKSLQSANQSKLQREEPTYFRVGFYGRILGDSTGREFIYRQPSDMTLPGFIEKMQKMHQSSATVGVEVVDSTITPELNSPNLVLQITKVSPYFTDTPFTYADTVTRINKFRFFTSFTKKIGLTTGKVGEEYTTRTILTTEQSFPSCRQVLKVVSKSEITLTPLETYLEEIEHQAQKIAETKDRARRDLEIILDGTLVFKVNQRPLRVAEEFLTNPNRYPEIHILRLCEALTSFLNALSSAVKKFTQLISVSEVEEQKRDHAYKKEFKSLSKKILALVKLAESSKSGSFIKKNNAESSELIIEPISPKGQRMRVPKENSQRLPSFGASPITNNSIISNNNNNTANHSTGENSQKRESADKINKSLFNSPTNENSLEVLSNQLEEINIINHNNNNNNNNVDNNNNNGIHKKIDQRESFSSFIQQQSLPDSLPIPDLGTVTPLNTPIVFPKKQDPKRTSVLSRQESAHSEKSSQSRLSAEKSAGKEEESYSSPSSSTSTSDSK